jgi:hypothetical protein
MISPRLIARRVWSGANFQANILAQRSISQLHSTPAEVSLVSDSSIELKWELNKGSRSYRIEYYKMPEGYYNMQVVTTPSISLKNLLPGCKYEYTISAISNTDIENKPLCKGEFSTVQVSIISLV